MTWERCESTNENNDLGIPLRCLGPAGHSGPHQVWYGDPLWSHNFYWTDAGETFDNVVDMRTGEVV